MKDGFKIISMANEVPWVDYESGEVVMISKTAYDAIVENRRKMYEFLNSKTNLPKIKGTIIISSTISDDTKGEDFKNLWGNK